MWPRSKVLAPRTDPAVPIASLISYLLSLIPYPSCLILHPSAEPVAKRINSCSVVVSPATSPASRPSCITRIRSQRPMSSGISEETTMTPWPAAAYSRSKRVDLGLGPDVDAAGRLVDDEQRGDAASERARSTSAGCRPRGLGVLLDGSRLIARRTRPGSRSARSRRLSGRTKPPRGTAAEPPAEDIILARSGRGTGPAISGPRGRRRSPASTASRIERKRRAGRRGRASPTSSGSAPKMAAHELRPAGAEEPGEAEDFAPAERKADVVGAPAAAEPAASNRTSPAAPSLAGKSVGQMAADHGHEDAERGVSAVSQRRHAAAVAEDGDPVAGLEDLVHAVGDVDDAHRPWPSACGSRRGRAPFRGSPATRWARRRHDLRLPGQGLEDLDDLAVSQVERSPRAASRRPGRIGEHRLGPLVEPAPIDQPAAPRLRPARMFSATERSGARLSSWWTMTIPATRASAGGRGKGPSAEGDPALVRRQDPGRDPHQRALARPVLADQRVDFAGADVEIDAVEHGHFAEALADAGQSRTGKSIVALFGLRFLVFGFWS